MNIHIYSRQKKELSYKDSIYKMDIDNLVGPSDAEIAAVLESNFKRLPENEQKVILMGPSGGACLHVCATGLSGPTQWILTNLQERIELRSIIARQVQDSAVIFEVVARRASDDYLCPEFTLGVTREIPGNLCRKGGSRYITKFENLEVGSRLMIPNMYDSPGVLTPTFTIVFGSAGSLVGDRGVLRIGITLVPGMVGNPRKQVPCRVLSLREVCGEYLLDYDGIQDPEPIFDEIKMPMQNQVVIPKIKREHGAINFFALGSAILLTLMVFLVVRSVNPGRKK